MALLSNLISGQYVGAPGATGAIGNYELPLTLASIGIPGATGATGPGMTLLGTITPTAVNSISLGSLTLTNYKALFIAFNNVLGNGASLYISASNTQTNNNVAKIGSGSPAGYGVANLDLGTGAISGTMGTGADVHVISGQTGISTSSTTIYFRLAGVSTWTAQGTITIYGI